MTVDQQSFSQMQQSSKNLHYNGILNMSFMKGLLPKDCFNNMKLLVATISRFSLFILQ